MSPHNIRTPGLMSAGQDSIWRPHLNFIRPMRRLYASLLSLLPFLCAAQGNVGLEINSIFGQVIKHDEKFTLPLPPISTALDIAVLKQTVGTQDWEQRRHYPIWGVGATWTHYGIDSVYGQAFGVYPFLQCYIIRGKRLEWTLRAGLGIAYATRHYERAPVWDTINVAIGSHINNLSRFCTDIRYRIDEHWSMQAGLDFEHMSNGAIKQPNLGINMWGGHVGVRYWPAGDRPQRIDQERLKLRNRILVQARLGIAFNEMGNTDGPMYHTFLGSLYASKRYRSRNKVFAGLDYSYHQRIYAFLRNNEILSGEEAAHSWRSAVFAGHEWLFGHMGVLVQMGVYIKDAELKQDPYYEKLGYNYYIIRTEHGPLKELCASVLLKTHKSIAELVEFGVGVGF